MTPRIRIRLSAAATMLGLAFLPAAHLRAQITLEAQQGTAWANSLTIPQLATLNFRWKWDGSPVTAASWQISFTSPTSTTHPTVVKSVRIDEVPPRSDQYGSFQIAADAMPSGFPGTFYVRVRSSNGVSAWLPVTVAQRAGIATGGASSPSTRQADGDREGVTSLSAKLPLAPVEPSSPPFVIPGGDGEETSFWINLVQLRCADPTGTEESDAAYAIVATVALNRSNLPASLVHVGATTIYDKLDPGDAQSFTLNVWGPENGAPMPIRNVEDAVILASVVVHKGTPPFLAKTLVESRIRNYLSTLPVTLRDVKIPYVRTELRQAMSSAMGDLVKAGNIVLGYNGGVHALAIEPLALTVARQGTVVEKKLVFDGMMAASGSAQYSLSFELGKSVTFPR